MSNLSKFIGLTYKRKGRSFDGVDCYGLVVLIYKDMLNVDLPEFNELYYKKEEWYDQKGKHIVSNIGSKLLRVEPPYEMYDGLIFYRNMGSIIADHIGVYIGDNKFIHIEEEKTSEICMLDGTSFGDRIYAALRFTGEWD